MKKSILTILLLLSFTFIIFAAKPEMVKFNVPANEVTSIETNQIIAVEYTQAPNTSVTVITPKRFKDIVKVQVKNGKLTTKFTSEAKMNNKEGVTVLVTAPSITEFEANSAASIKINGPLSLPGKEVEIDLSSAASFSAGAINCAKLEIECSSASSATIASCKADIIDAESTSASNLTVNGINATLVKGESNSTSSLKLSGNCTTAKLNKSSMGSINRRGLKTKE